VETLCHAARACSASAACGQSVRAGRWRSCAPQPRKPQDSREITTSHTNSPRSSVACSVASQLRGSHSATSSPLNAHMGVPHMSYRRAPVSTPSSVTSSPGPSAKHNM